MDGRIIQTVLGPVPARRIGPTLIHEHLLADITPTNLFPPDEERIEITLQNVWDIRYQWCAHYGNQILDDKSVIIGELLAFLSDGGSCIVEQTSRGLKPDPRGLAELSMKSGVHIVAGTGFYTFEYNKEQMTGLSFDDMCEMLTNDLRSG